MNIEEIKNKMKKFYNNNDELVLETYFVLKKSDNIETIKRADFEERMQLKLRDEFLKNINNSIISNEELRLENVSQATNEKNMLLYYDLDELESFSILKELNSKEDFAIFSFNEDELSEITGIMFLLHHDEHTFISYKRSYPINLLRKDSRGLKFWQPPTSERFVEVPEDIYSIYPDMDFFMLDSKIYIINLTVLERFFDFREVIKQFAEDAINKIDNIEILVDTDILRDFIDEMPQARKLTQVSKYSPVVGEVDNESIIEFVNSHPALTGKFKFNEDRTKIELDTKISAKLFIKLLNDDYLLSELTDLHYDTRAKSAVDNFKDDKK